MQGVSGCSRDKPFAPTIRVLVGLRPDASPDAGRPIEEIVGAPAAAVAHLSK
jgi:hypothetical protein